MIGFCFSFKFYIIIKKNDKMKGNMEFKEKFFAQYSQKETPFLLKRG